ncbi:CmcJ/NvfI family oxidoreductase [Undibacterium sp. Ji50W]|uniref:CmcJ/NvfI family oxidoreductase n=1 Tax=Undibacterium sp. Ji50W TaxID=3413041 RepID=UPI003BF1FA34
MIVQTEQNLYQFQGKPSSDDGLVVASMSYVIPSGTRPCSYTFQPPPGIPWESADYDLRSISIHDARQADSAPQLEREGFELWDAATSVKDFLNLEEIRSVYYQEARELALAATGARKAYVFDHLLRKREATNTPLSFGKRAANGMAAANGRIHNDYTEASGKKRLDLVIQDVEELAQVRRYSIVNIWRPIRNTVLDTPLAVCDARTVEQKDLVSCDVRYPNRTGEIYLVNFAARHHWSYFSRMEPHEAMVFKQYDSQFNGCSRFTPHAAFDHPHIPAHARPRESIELRCLVIY